MKGSALPSNNIMCIELMYKLLLMAVSGLYHCCLCFLQGDEEAQKAAAQAEFQEILEEAKKKAAEEEEAEKASASDNPDASSTSDVEAKAETEGATGASDEVQILDDDTATSGTTDGESSGGQD